MSRASVRGYGGAAAASGAPGPGRPDGVRPRGAPEGAPEARPRGEKERPRVRPRALPEGGPGEAHKGFCY